MFAKAVVILFHSFFFILAAAMPGDYPPPTKTITVTATPTATTISQCNTGDSQCCNTVGAADSIPVVGAILGLLGIVLQDLSVIVGIGCTPITILGIGASADCAQQPVCCENNNFNGLINIGCVPINIL